MNGLEHLPLASGTRKQQREAEPPARSDAPRWRNAAKGGTPDPGNSEPSPPQFPAKSRERSPLPDQQSVVIIRTPDDAASDCAGRRDATRDRARSGTLAQAAARGSWPGEGSRKHGGRVYVEEEGGEVDHLLRRRRPSSCTAAPSPVRPGHRRRGIEAWAAGGWRGGIGSGGEGRWAEIVLPGRRVTPRCVRRCGGGRRSGGDSGRDATRRWTRMLVGGCAPFLHLGPCPSSRRV
jgi:hypothetical protein